MKWPFARHLSPAAVTVAHETASGNSPTAMSGASTVMEHGEHDAGPSRRDWATLSPLRVAGARPISLTAAPLAFIEQLATKQHLVSTPRLTFVRPLDAPSGSLRGVLSHQTHDEMNPGSVPTLHEGSPLPSAEHRHLAALAATERGGDASDMSAIAQLLAIGDPNAASPLSTAPLTQSVGDSSGGDGGDVVDDKPRGARRFGLADSRRTGLGPAYHGPLPEAMRAERGRDNDGGGEQPAGTRTEQVPGDVRAAMRDMLGIDVGDRLVHRGPAVSAEAQGMGAKAFTRDGEIFIADEVGPLDQAKGKSTLAHELTHAAQQVVHGAPPDEASPGGQALEAHAQRVEQFVRGDGGAIKPTPDLLHARPRPGTETSEAGLESTTRQMMRELIDTGLARPDGTGGIIFTMPPSSMTGSAGTQRLTDSATTAHPTAGVHQEGWDPLATFGNTLSQGFGNDLLSGAGSMFGFSEGFMGEQRGQLAGSNLQFRREQTQRAYTELRMEHLRGAELTRRNAEEALFNGERSTSLDAATLEQLEHRIQSEVNERLQLLDEQTARALDQLNRQRATRHEEALRAIPEEGYDAALRRLFDDAQVDAMPAEADILSALVSNPGGRTGGARPSGGAGGAPTGGTAGGTQPAPGAARGTGTPSGAPGGATPGGTSGPGGAGAHHQPDPEWLTNSTMGGRFEAIGAAFAHDEIAAFGSFFGADDSFAHSLHEGVSPTHSAAAHNAAGSPTSTPAAQHSGATPGTHGAGPHGAAAHGATAHPAAHETVENIVGDPYALDELAMRLYPNIRSRLRQELLIDRERAGLLADFR